MMNGVIRMEIKRRLTRHGLVAILGGLSWGLVRIGTNVSWDIGFLGLKYEDWNRLEPLPLLLLLLASLALYQYRPAGARSAPWAMGVTLLGYAGLLVGVVMEFWVEGGWGAETDPFSPYSQMGWHIFLASTFILTIGLSWFGILLRQRSWVPLLLGLTFLPAQFFLPPLGTVGWIWVGWVLFGEKRESAAVLL